MKIIGLKRSQSPPNQQQHEHEIVHEIVPEIVYRLFKSYQQHFQKKNDKQNIRTKFQAYEKKTTNMYYLRKKITQLSSGGRLELRICKGIDRLMRLTLFPVNPLSFPHLNCLSHNK